jgi:uncharacterized protein (DUF2267 family)
VPAKLLQVLAQARAAYSFPWRRRTLYWRTVFPQMTNRLSEEEGAQLQFEFEVEIRWLEAPWRAERPRLKFASGRGASRALNLVRMELAQEPNEVIAAFVQDKTVIERGLLDEDLTVLCASRAQSGLSLSAAPEAS